MTADRRSSGTHISFHQVVHAVLRNFLGLVELLQRLLNLLVRNLPLTLLLVVVVQTTALQLLQVVLQTGTNINFLLPTLTSL